MKTMMPKVISQNFENMELIRPLYFVKEEHIIKWAKYNNLDFISLHDNQHTTTFIKK